MEHIRLHGPFRDPQHLRDLRLRIPFRIEQHHRQSLSLREFRQCRTEAISQVQRSGLVRRFREVDREDGVLTRAEWLTELTRATGDAAAADSIARMLDTGVADPAAEIARLFDRTGVAYRLTAGRLTLE